MGGPFHTYSQWAKKIAPRVQAALAGERDIPVQPPLTEAWLTYALFWNESPLSLKDVIQNADTVGHAIPNPEEIAWAFLRLRKRRWLSEQGKSFALTVEGRRSIERVVGKGNFRERFERLIDWVLAHPPP